MDATFWHERWAQREIGFHRSTVHPMLKQHWPTLADRDDRPVLVPLCGKSRDLKWLADRGHPVVGVELSEAAAIEFFEDHGLQPEPTRLGGLGAWRAASITICVGDFFEFAPDSPFPRIYDRAAMIALPAEARARYRARLAALLADEGQGLLITLEYDPSTMNGPPFSVDEAELALDPRLHYRSLEAVDALPDHPGFRNRGVAALTERASAFRHAPVDR